MFGALVGIFLFGTLSENLLLILIASTILFLTWAPIDNFILSVMKNDWFCGLISGFAGIFVGANGPLVTAYLRTKNLLLLEVSRWLIMEQLCILFIFILALTGYAGANIGRRVISTIPFDSFNIALKLLLTFLSIFLII